MSSWSTNIIVDLVIFGCLTHTVTVRDEDVIQDALQLIISCIYTFVHYKNVCTSRDMGTIYI